MECPVLYPCLLLLYLHGLNTRAKLYAYWEHKHGQPPMATVTSLYIFSSYIYTYFYNFNSFSSYIPIACQYFSITCSMSLTYPLSILFLYSYFYTLPILILVMCSSFTLIICLLNVPFRFQVTYHVSILCLFHLSVL